MATNRALFLVTGNIADRPEDWTVNDVQQALALNTGTFVAENRAYLEGDHWQDGAGWIGPQPNRSESGFTETMRAIELAFTSRNVIAEIIGRHANGVTGREPRWRFTPKRFLAPGEMPNDKELQDIALIESMVTGWWDKRKTISILQAATRNALFAERGPVRLFIPRGLLRDVGGVTVADIDSGDLEAALDLIWPEAPDPESSTVFIDPMTKQEVGIVVEQDRAGLETFTICYKAENDPEQTVVRMMTGSFAMTGTPPSSEDTFTLAIGGRLTVGEIIRCPRLVNEQILQGQRALNLALSMIPRTVVTAGFLERILLNAQMPGEFVDIKDSAGRVIGKRFVPSTPVFGAGTTNYVAPLAVEEDDGRGGTRTVMTNADVKWREPVDPVFAVNAKIAHYQDILEEANQAHILITSDATPSGNSREQARAEYEGSLNETKPHVDAVGRWLLETVVALAEDLAGTPGKYTDLYRVVYESNVDTGPLTPDEKRQYFDAADRGYLSAQGAMELSGVEDVDAEQARIKAEGAGNVGQMLERATALKTLIDAKFPMSVAVKLLGIPEELHAEIISEMDKAQAAEQQQAVDLAKATKPPVAAPGAKPAASGGPPAPAPKKP